MHLVTYLNHCSRHRQLFCPWKMMTSWQWRTVVKCAKTHVCIEETAVWIFHIVIQNFFAIRSAVLEKMTMEVDTFVYSRNEIVISAQIYGDPDVKLNLCAFCRVTIPVLCINVEVQVRRSFWFHSQLSPYSLIMMKLNSDDIYHLSKDRFRERLESPLASTLIATSHVPLTSLKPAENAERSAESWNDIVYIDASAFTACFAFVFLVYCFRVAKSY